MKRLVRLYRVILLVGAMILATVALGWWGVLFVAALFPLMDRRWTVPAEAAWAAGAAWLVMFLANVMIDGPGIVAQVGRALTIPAWALPVLTIVFPAILAWSGATVVAALAQFLGRARHFGAPTRVGD